MPVDVRATVTCSLGTLISGNISDSYIQGNGLVQTQGAVEIAGTITPAVGTAVTFAYKYNGGTRNLPRKLRVLSSFADPLRRTTRVQLGCKLTYLSDLRQRLKWSALDDPENAGLSAADAEIITIPIYARSVFAKCLTELGLTSSSNPLTNRFSVAEYDYSAGYVAVMAELLTSENYFGYLDFNEVLQVVNLNQNGGTAVVVGTGQIIDLSDINAGALPGEAVTVNYSSLQLKAAPEVDDWSTSRSSNRSSVTISYSDPLDGTRQTIIYGVLETEEETSDFQPLTKASTGERLNVLRYRKVERTESSPKVLGSVMVQLLEAGISPPIAQLQTTTEEWFYYDAEGNEIRTVKETYADRAYGFGQVSLPMVFDTVGGGKQAVSLPIGQTYLQDAVETETTVQGTLRKIVTRRYGNWLATIAGQQAVAEGRDSFTTTAQVENYLATALSGKWFLGADIRTEDNTSSSQRVPFKSEVINQQYSKGGNPANGYRTESNSQVVLALGSATAQRRTEFTLPKAPDDYFFKSGSSYGSIRSDAKAKAQAYGRVQNRLLLGNRSGMNLRLAAWQMPEQPFAPLVVQANGLSALYRANATSYTISAEGIVAATDALFWGAVGGTGSFWFPVAPGVTTLPSTPATSTLAITGTNDANQTVTIATLTTMAVSSLVLPYNETAVLAPTTRTTLVATSLPYALTASTAQAVTTRAKLHARRVWLVDVPAAGMTVAGAAPTVSTGTSVPVPAALITVAGEAPTIRRVLKIQVPAAEVTVAAVAPDQVGKPATSVLVPAAEVSIAAAVPVVVSGASVAVPVGGIATAAVVPAVAITDPFFSNVIALLHMNGSNNSTTFTNTATNAATFTANGNAKISTDQAKFGTASGYLDGTGDYINSSSTAVRLSSGNHTVEFWIYATVTTAGYLWSQYQASSVPAGRCYLGLDANSKVVLQLGSNVVTSTTSISANTWTHIAYVRNGTTNTLYINGADEGSFTSSQTLFNGQMRFGTQNNNTEASPSFINFYTGYFDELRISTRARYTAAFTPTTAQFPDS